jgi:hypothetical protein
MSRKNSFGVICIRDATETPVEILMIKKSWSYAFCEFVSGRYDSNESVVDLFSNMTTQEKIAILAGDFQTLWFMIYQNKPENLQRLDKKDYWDHLYGKKKNKFEKIFSNQLIQNAIKNSDNLEIPWEFPRGRQSNDEKNIETAIREFEEESQCDHFRMLSYPPVIEEYDDCGTKYVNTYWFAMSRQAPKNLFLTTSHSLEIASTKWKTKNAALEAANTIDQKKRLARVFSMAKKIRKELRTNFRELPL